MYIKKFNIIQIIHEKISKFYRLSQAFKQQKKKEKETKS